MRARYNLLQMWAGAVSSRLYTLVARGDVTSDGRIPGTEP